MIILKLILNLANLYIYFNLTQSLDLRGRGVPVPHAEELDRMISKFMNFTEYDGTIFRYLFGLDSDPINGTDPENLEISILDADTIAKIVNKAHKRFQAISKNNARRKYGSDERDVKNNEDVLVEKVLDMMVQSIYMANLRMRDTKPYRERYRNNVGYNMAIMFGALMTIRAKMGELYAIMHNFRKKTHFLWYLVIYEKILAFHVDVTNMCDKIFMMHEERMSKKSDATTEKNKDEQADKIAAAEQKFNIDLLDPDSLAHLLQVDY